MSHDIIALTGTYRGLYYLCSVKKWFSILLIILTTAGSFFPCCQEDECIGDQLAQTSHQEKHEDKGNCSPFFACGTCAAALDVNLTNITIENPVPPTIHHTSLYLFQLGNYSASFFQPPRLS